MVTQQQRDEFTAFRQSCIWLRNCYNIFNHLYDSGPDTEATLRRIAALFFTDLNSILQEYFFLQVRRISDPAETRRKQNLTLQSVNNDLEQSGLMTQEIADLSSKILAYRNLIKDISNRVIAHIDKGTVLRSGLVGAHSESELQEFMSHVQAYTDAVGNALGVGPLDYRTQAGAGDVLDLVRALKQA